MEATGDELLSSGCSEGAVKLKEKSKEKTSLPVSIKQLTCMEMARSRLMNNSRCAIPSGGSKSRPKSESQCYVKSGSKEMLSTYQEERKNANTKKSASLWNSQAETLRRSNSEVNRAILLLNKRLEYGKQASSSNRSQLMQSKLKKEEEAKKLASRENFAEPRSVENPPTELVLELLDSCISKFSEIGIKLRQIRDELD